MNADVLAQAREGRKLFPILARGKTPLIADWPTKATSDERQLETWERAHPRCNWGAVTGSGSGIWVLDVDEAGSEWVAAQTKQYGESWLQIRRETRNGFHLIYRYQDGAQIRNSAGRVARGIDVRGVNGYAIVPPSVHPTGTPYAWLGPPTLAPIPPRNGFSRSRRTRADWNRRPRSAIVRESSPKANATRVSRVSRVRCVGAARHRTRSQRPYSPKTNERAIRLYRKVKLPQSRNRLPAINRNRNCEHARCVASQLMATGIQIDLLRIGHTVAHSRKPSHGAALCSRSGSSAGLRRIRTANNLDSRDTVENRAG